MSPLVEPCFQLRPPSTLQHAEAAEFAAAAAAALTADFVGTVVAAVGAGLTNPGPNLKTLNLQGRKFIFMENYQGLTIFVSIRGEMETK